MIKKHKLFQLSAPSQLKQTLDCVCLPKVKNIESRRKTRDATKKLFTNDTALVRKTQDATEQIPNEITITNNTRSKHEGDEEYTDVKERTRINEEEENKTTRNNKLENVDLMSNVSNNELKITNDNSHKHRDQNESSVNKQDELDKVNTSFKSQNMPPCIK